MPGMPLRADIEHMNSDGSGMTAQLCEALEGLRQAPIDDTVGEGPHARLRHIQLKTRAASWPFQAATDRLSQNLDDIKNVLPTIRPHTDLQFVWNNYKAVAKLHPRIFCRVDR